MCRHLHAMERHLIRTTVTLLATAVIAAGCTSTPPGDTAAQVARTSPPETTAPPAPATSGVSVRGRPPHDALDITVDAHRAHELRLEVLAERLDDVRRLSSAERQRRRRQLDETYDVTASTPDGVQVVKLRGHSILEPVLIPDRPEGVTVTFARTGKPRATLTVFIDGDGRAVVTGSGPPPRLAEHRVVYDIRVTWPDEQTGYAVVTRGPAPPGEFRKLGSTTTFTRRPRHRQIVGAGERLAVAVFAGFDSRREAQHAPMLGHGDRATILVAPG